MTREQFTASLTDPCPIESRCRSISVLLLAACGLLAVVVVLAIAGSASADSLVFTKPDGNVYLVNPDGSGQYQVTLDGTASDRYTDASQDDNGTIVAVHGSGPSAQIVRMTQNGTFLNAPFKTAVPGTGPMGAIVSPDGSKVAYWGATGVSLCYGFCLGVAKTYQVSYPDHYVDPSTFIPRYAGWTSFQAPAWLGSSRNLLFTGSGTAWVYDLGASEPFQWFQSIAPSYQWPGANGSELCCLVDFQQGAASQDGTRLAVVIGNGWTGQYEIAIFSTAGDLATGMPPADPTLGRCFINPPDGGSGVIGGTYPGEGALFESPSWSADDSSLAFVYDGAIYVAKLPSLTDCTQDSITEVVSSGSNPVWGSANVDPQPRPAPTPPRPTPHPQPPGSARVGFPRTGKLLRISGKNALAALTCTNGTGVCDGTVAIQSARASSKSKETTYAAGTYSLTAGKAHTVRLRLSRSGRSLAHTHRTVTVWINISIAGSTVELSERVRVRF